MLTSALAFIVLIGILIWFHELGHFLMAKLFRVRVEVFSIGFGPVLLSKRLGETLYQIAAIPLGGYVKLYGEEESSKEPYAFSAKPPWQRIIIALGGPVFNIILTVFLFTLVMSLGVEVPKYEKQQVVVGHVAENSWAQKAGLKPGDKILSLNGVPIKEWNDLRRLFLEEKIDKKSRAILEVERGGRLVKIEVEVPDLTGGKGVGLGILPKIEPVIGDVLKNSPASQVGLKKGDRILAVNGKPVESWYQMVKEIQASEGKPIKLTLEREGKRITKIVIPSKNPRTGKPFLGVSPKIETVKESYPLPEAFSKALERTKELTLLTFKVLGGLLTGGVSVKTLGGPIAIAQFAGQAAQSGIVPYLSSMAFISLQLGIFNLLPLPILDGGLILLFLVEMIRRKPLPEKFKEYWQKVGFALILALMGFVIVNDILRLITGG